MSKVLIVSKTHMGQHVCVGAFCRETRQSLRLFRADGHELTETDGYAIGQVWEMEYQPAPDIEPPHTEDVRVTRRACERTLTPHDTREAILRYVEPVSGSIEALFDGMLHILPGEDRSACLTRARFPCYSTEFWIADRPLAMFGGPGGEPYYRYTDGHGSVKIKFVGFQKPLMTVPAGALLRMSLARWKQFEGDSEPRCWLQLSGWWV